MEKVDAGRPLGERLTWWPVRGAVAVKKRGWARAWMGRKGLEGGGEGTEGLVVGVDSHDGVRNVF